MLVTAKACFLFVMLSLPFSNHEQPETRYGHKAYGISLYLACLRHVSLLINKALMEMKA